MSQVSCAHNAPTQVAVVGRLVPCRKCGMLVEPAPEAVNAEGQVGQANLGSAPGTIRYPGGHSG
jgi:hypothetical protein